MLPGCSSVPKQRLERFSLRFIVDVGGAAFKFLHLAHKSSEYTAVQAHYDTQNDQRMSGHEYPRDQIATDYTFEQERIPIGCQPPTFRPYILHIEHVRRVLYSKVPRWTE